MGCTNSIRLNEEQNATLSRVLSKIERHTQTEVIPHTSQHVCDDYHWRTLALFILEGYRGFWWFTVERTVHQETAFVFHRELSRHVQMPFELKIASGTFQCAMNDILSSENGSSFLASLHSCIFALPHKSHEKVFIALTRCRITLKFKKCNFFTDTFGYLYHVIRRRLLNLATHTADTVRQWLSISNRTQIKQSVCPNVPSLQLDGFQS